LSSTSSLYNQFDPVPFPTRRSSDLRSRETAPRPGGLSEVRRRDPLAFDRHRRQHLLEFLGGLRMRFQGAHFNGEIDEASVDLVPDRKSTRLNSSHVSISYAVFCLKK